MTLFETWAGRESTQYVGKIVYKVKKVWVQENRVWDDLHEVSGLEEGLLGVGEH